MWYGVVYLDDAKPSLTCARTAVKRIPDVSTGIPIHFRNIQKMYVTMVSLRVPHFEGTCILLFIFVVLIHFCPIMFGGA